MITITYTNDDEEVSAQLPSIKVVCPTCGGHGHVLAPGMRGHAYVQEEFDEAFDDEQREEYFKRGGMYDVQCEKCNGKNVVDEVDEDRLTAEQRVHYEAWRESQREDAEFEAMCRAERAMGA